MKGIFLSLFLLFSILVNGQVLLDTDLYKKKLSKINLTDQIPADLLNGKSVVIHAYSNAQNDYKKLAIEMQPGFQKAGIDVVSHYLFENIYSGVESLAAYKKQLEAREIDFLIYLLNNNGPQLIIFPYDNNFFTESAFGIEGKDLKSLMHDLYLTTARSDQELLNLLILETPAYPESPKVIEGRRAEFYDLNMKSGKVAIPKTEDSLTNKAIDSVMTAYYPYGFGFVEPGMTDAELRKEGYWFILYAIHSSGKSVKQLLEYPITPEETAFASIVADGRETEVKTISTEIPVYKFYIKHIQSGDTYLGKHYDADERWEVALKNYILNLKNILR